MSLEDVQKVVENALTKAAIEELKVFINQSVSNAIGLQIANLKKALDVEISNKVSNSISAVIDDPGFGAKLTTSLEDSLRNNSIVWNNIKIPHEAVNFKTFKLSADAISDGILKKFSSQGIEDQASDIQLTVFDQGIVVENKTLTRQLEVAEGALINKSLVVNGVMAVKGELQVSDSTLSNLTQKVLSQAVVQLSSPTSSVRIPASSIDFSQFSLQGSKVSGPIQKFTSTGIADYATTTQLAITNEGIVVSDKVKSSTVEVLSNAMIGGSLQVEGSVAIAGDLIVDGSVSLTDKSFVALASQAASKVQQTVDTQIPIVVSAEIQKQLSAKTFDLGSITISGAPLIQGRKLANTIIETNIQTLGELRDLTVLGGATIGRILSVSQQKRVGINTIDPQYTVDIWDQEVEVVVHKIGSKNAYFGTTRDQTLSLGTNNKVALTITPEGIVSVNQFKVGRNSIAFSANSPNYAGANGDVVFNTAVKVGAPVGWICAGGTKWHYFSIIQE